MISTQNKATKKKRKSFKLSESTLVPRPTAHINNRGQKSEQTEKQSAQATDNGEETRRHAELEGTLEKGKTRGKVLKAEKGGETNIQGSWWEKETTTMRKQKKSELSQLEFELRESNIAKIDGLLRTRSANNDDDGRMLRIIYALSSIQGGYRVSKTRPLPRGDQRIQQNGNPNEANLQMGLYSQ